MTEEQTKKYQKAQLELSDLLDNLCKELGINYYLIGGTLLGAVRHKGFIPWDTDIDVAMVRSDYEKFKKYWQNRDDDNYFYQHYTTEKNHRSPHALLKIKKSLIVNKDQITKYKCAYNGIYLDIFPLDNPPENEKKRKKQAKKIKNISRIIYLKSGYVYQDNGKIKKLMKKIVSKLLFFVSFKYLNTKLDQTMQKYNDSSSEYLVSMASHYSYKKQLMPKEIYGEPVRIEFEGRQYCAPAKTHEYLTRIFKDYMKLPPEEEREKCFAWIDRIEYGE